MAKMFGYRWADGNWYHAPEPGTRQAIQPEPKREWVRRGFFKDFKRMSRHDVALKASNARMWLEYILRQPMLAREVLQLAKLEGISQRGLRRAKRHLRIKSIRAGGKGTGRRNPWIWQTPVSN